MPRPQLSYRLPAGHTCQLNERQLPPQSPCPCESAALQIMAATRIKVSKLRFLVGAFKGKQWEEDELFLPEESVRDEAAETLRRYRITIKVSGGERSGWDQHSSQWHSHQAGSQLATTGQVLLWAWPSRAVHAQGLPSA